MAATNTSAATATLITSLPYSITVSAADINSSPGATHPLWWKYTNTLYAQVSEYAQGSPFGVTFPVGHTFNVPLLTLWTGSPGSLTPYPPTAGTNQGPILTPFLSPGTTVYIEIEVGSDGIHATEPVDDPMTFQMFPGALLGAPTGSLLIPDFNSDFPSVLLGTNGQILQTPNLVACDFGAILDDGTIALIDNSTNPPPVKIYSPTGTLLYTRTGLTTALTFQQIQGDGVDDFYVGGSTTSVAATVKKVSKTNVVGGTTWTLPANSKSLRGMAPNRTETILYYTSFNIGVNGNNVRRYDISGAGAAMTDLKGDIGGGYIPQKDLFVMGDGSILVGYRASATDAKIVRYDTAGNTLNTYVIPTDHNFDRFALGTDDPLSFWTWTFVNADAGLATLTHYQTNTGSVLSSFDVPVFVDGNYAGNNSNNPPRFGVSNSCPLLIIRQAFPGATPPGSQPEDIDYTTRTLITRRQRTAPHLSNEQGWVFYPQIQFDFESGVGLVTGQGSDPVVMVDWSDDGGQVYSQEHRASLGALGHYTYRSILRRLGRSRDRIFRVTVTDPVRSHLIGAYFNPPPQPGTS